mmetsp:Transcript_43843/g.50435  ORF Transcript_43843/g.50435 Transcript_43843/m.50435 type:complete len:105 (-) Transcript_43843:621-935(-)
MEPTYVEPSQRSDGSWRKEIRIKPGYVPKEERPIYISKGKQIELDRQKAEREANRAKATGNFYPEMRYCQQSDLTASLPFLLSLLDSGVKVRVGNSSEIEKLKC